MIDIARIVNAFHLLSVVLPEGLNYWKIGTK